MSAPLKDAAVRREPTPNPASAWSILRWSVLHRAACLALLQISAQLLPHFDSSAYLLFLRKSSPRASSATAWLSPLIRWDTLHFLGVASPEPLPPSPDGLAPASALGGYESEHTLAFQAGVPALLHWAGQAADSATGQEWSIEQAVTLATAASLVCSILSPVLLFILTRRLYSNERFASIAACLSILSPAPATLLSPTPEVFFSFVALLGLCILLGGSEGQERTPRTASLTWRLLLSSAVFALSTAFRANGVLLAGFLLWQGIWAPALARRLAMSRAWLAAVALLGTLVACAPFLSAQYWAFERFCKSASPARPWCSKLLPSVYSFVQREYWDVGLLRYWQIAQIPNFVLAAPVLALILLSMRQGLRQHRRVRQVLLAPLNPPAAPTKPSSKSPTPNPLDHLSSDQLERVLPHALFLWINGVLLLFFSHVQIALRFASPGGMPALWWIAAEVVGGRSGRAGGYLVTWLVLWNAASLLLYSGFYPPA